MPAAATATASASHTPGPQRRSPRNASASSSSAGGRLAIQNSILSGSHHRKKAPYTSSQVARPATSGRGPASSDRRCAIDSPNSNSPSSAPPGCASVLASPVASPAHFCAVIGPPHQPVRAYSVSHASNAAQLRNPLTPTPTSRYGSASASASVTA